MSVIKKLLKDKAKAIENNKFEDAATLCNAIGNEYLTEEKFEEALQEHFEELNYCQIAEDESGIGVAHRRIGECYCSLNKFTKALHHIKKFYEISIKLGSVVEQQRAFVTLGRAYFLKYEYHKSLENSDNDLLSKTIDEAELHYYKAFDLLRNINSEVTPAELADMKCGLLLNLGLVSENRGDDKKSLELYAKGLKIALKNNIYDKICRCGCALGSSYHRLGKYRLAENAYNEALKATKKLHNKITTCGVLLSKGINLICLQEYKEAKKYLKTAYKLKTPNSEDSEKITRYLKVCIGIINYETKLKTCKNLHERKIMFEKIADGLASIDCFDLAIEKYHQTLDCIKESDLSAKAPIYFSLAATYLDKKNIAKALEYFEKEYICNKDRPLEQIQTLWKIAQICENEKEADKSEEFYQKAASLAKETGDQKYIYKSLAKLLEFYDKFNKTDLADEIKQKIDNIEPDNVSEEEIINEEPFDDISLSDMSDSDVDEEIVSTRKRRKQIESKINDEGETPLHRACIENNINLVKQLVKNGHSVTVRDNAGWTPLHEACSYGHYDIVKFLLENGAGINEPGGSEEGFTPLHDAAQWGNLDVMQLLISKGAKVTVLDKNGRTPLGALLEWKRNADLDDIALKQCKAIEEELKLKMAETGGVTFKNNSDYSDSKSNKSTSSSENTDSDDDDVSISQYTSRNNSQVCNEAKTASKLGMKNLQFSTANISPLKCKKTNSSAHLNENEIADDWLMKDSSDVSYQNCSKRNRSPTSSSSTDSDNDSDGISPYLTENNNELCNDAKTEYKSVMESLRRSAANISPIKYKKAKTNVSALVNEKEIVNDWLVKDTGKIPEIKRKKRKRNKLNVRTSKCIDRYLTAQDSNEANSVMNVSDESSSFTSSSNPVNRNAVSINENQQSCSSLKPEHSVVAFCLRVNVADKLILVPVPKETCTINWLKEEAALRYQSIDGSKPHLTLTKNGALLSGADLIKNIFSNNEEVQTSVDMWQEPSLDDKYVQLCQKHNTVVSSGIRNRFSDLATSFEMNMSNCSLSYAHLNIVFQALLNYKNLKHLNFTGTPLSRSNLAEFVNCIPSLSNLLTLNFSCCNLTSEKMNIFLNYLNNKIENTTVLPSLKIIDLSCNLFSPCPDFTVFFKLNNLCSLNLCSCGLNSTFLSSMLLQKIEENRILEELDISDNNFRGDEIANFLHHLPKANLKKLNLKCVVEREESLGFKIQSFLMGILPSLMQISLQGCFLTDTDLNLISTSLNFCPKLQIVNLSANPLLSSDCITNFINILSENNLAVTEIDITGTCHWYEYDIYNLTSCIKLKSLKRFCFDNCQEIVVENIMQSWTEKWDDKALCIKNFLFCELSIK